MRKNFNPKISLHYSFILLIIASIFLGQTWLILLYFAFLVIHEGVHKYFAKKRGYKIGKIKLLATGAVLEAESDEFSFSDEIIIAISAPIFNLCLALITIAFWWIIPESYNYTQDICVLNLSIFAFNILPIFPLDGGRVLLALLSKKMDRRSAVKICRAVSFILCVLIFLLFILSFFSMPNFSLGVMAVTLFVGSISEDKNAVYKKLILLSRKAERTKKRGVEVRWVCVDESLTISKLYSLLDARHYTIFLRTKKNFQLVEKLEEREVIERINQ